MEKKILNLSALLLLTIFFVETTSAQEENWRDPETWILGYFKQDALLQEPHDSWFNDEFDAYEFESDAFMLFSEIPKDDIRITIVLGTWCPDSRREVPRFLKILQSSNFPMDQVTFIGVDSYKVAPVENYDNLNIERVPTFIFYRNKVEVGRIIEYPKSSLERDMVQMLSKMVI